ncbi:MAG: SurA N-terminal domain-containing protein [Bacteroidales bacterium]|nr:SurA N-terminal domain-containing protein [Bacteroidales bacterium]
MATLEKIRNRAGLLVAIIIGMALFAFILGDLLSSGNSLFTNSQFEIAKVAGKSISYNVYQRKVDDLAEINKIQLQRNNLDEQTIDNIRTASWENLIQELVMDGEMKKLGIGVHSDELFDMIQGDDPHPLIKQMFTNPETGILNRSVLLSFLRQIQQDQSSEQKTYWLYLENEFIRQRMFTKYINLVKQGLYANSLEAKYAFINNNKKVNFDYVVQRYNTVPDSLISFSEEDLKKYYKEHKHEYEQEESRDIKYVYFEVVPSEADDQAAQKWISDILPDFTTIKAEDTRQYINLNSDFPYDDRNYKKEELPEIISEFMNAATPGDVYGPYFENGSYKLAKLAAINFLPDSVHARHILLQANQNNVNQMYALADSLKTMINNGANFAALAMTHSTDGSAQDGGDLGWFKEGDMVKQFSDSCFYGKKGDLKIVGTQFGIHIIQILDQSRPVKKMQVGILARRVDPSDETDQVYYAKASEFAGLNNTWDKFNAAAAEQKLPVLEQNGLAPLDKAIPGLESPRALIKWAYNADLQDVSEVFKLGNKYVIAAVAAVREKGYATLKEKQTEIEIEVIKEKKGAQIAENINKLLNSGSSLEDIGASLNTTVLSATGVSFNSRNLTGMGLEPKVIAAATYLEVDKLSKPIAGNNGVFVINVTSATDVPEEPNLAFEKSVLNRNYAARANYAAYEALKETAKIEDHREKFF